MNEPGPAWLECEDPITSRARLDGCTKTPAQKSPMAIRRSAPARGVSRGFPPVVGDDPKVLVVGSLPGAASIAANQYYAQPRNAFWRIMGALCGAGPELAYAERLEALRRAGIALWDVLAAAERPGSLDSAIVLSTAEANDFATLFSAHTGIRLVCCNGRKATDLYTRRVVPTLPSEAARLRVETLPSTSPAYAGMRFDAKLERWRWALGSSLRS